MKAAILFLMATTLGAQQVNPGDMKICTGSCLTLQDHGSMDDGVRLSTNRDIGSLTQRILELEKRVKELEETALICQKEPKTSTSGISCTSVYIERMKAKRAKESQ